MGARESREATVGSSDATSSMTCPNPPPPSLLFFFSRYPALNVAAQTYSLISIAAVLIFLAAPWFLLRRFKGRRRRRGGRGAESELLRHAVVTGGSSGIGLAVARELCVRRKCRRVTLLARKLDGLEAAKDSIEKELILLGLDGSDEDEDAKEPPCKIDIISVDVTDPDAITKAADDICRPSKDRKDGKGGSHPGPPSLLFNVAGTSSSGRFVETDPAEFERLMRINYLGTAYATRAFLPHMMENRSSSSSADDADPKGANSSSCAPATIVLTSSGAGQVGIYGYAAYSPTKFALRGLAQCLAMEVPNSIAVQVAYPPDTDTPGYQLEQVGKPRETELISDVMGLARPEDVARVMVDSALAPNPKFDVYFGLEGWMLSTLTAGMGPAQGLLDIICQVFLMGLLRFVSLFYLWDFRRIVAKCRRGGEEKKKKGDGDASAARQQGEGEMTGDDHPNGGETIKGEWLCGGAGW